MGIFNDISKMFNNTVGKGLSTVTGGASQNVGNILKGKGNIGDLLNIGMFAGTGGLSGLGNIGKMSGLDFLQLLPLMSGSNQSSSGYNLPSNLNDLANQLSAADMASLLMRVPARNASLDRAYNSLTPSGAASRAKSIANQMANRGAESGAGSANMLKRQGYASSVQDAARLQGRNEGISRGNQAMASLLSPQSQSQNALLQSQIYSPSNLQGGGLNMMLGLQNAANNQRIADAQYNATRPASFLETLLGIGGQVLPYVLNNNSGAKQSEPVSQGDIYSSSKGQSARNRAKTFWGGY